MNPEEIQGFFMPLFKGLVPKFNESYLIESPTGTRRLAGEIKKKDLFFMVEVAISYEEVWTRLAM